MDCKPSADSASRKRSPSSEHDEGSTVPLKSAKVCGASSATGVTSERSQNSEAESKKTAGRDGHAGNGEEASAVRTDKDSDDIGAKPVNSSTADGHIASSTEKPQSSDAPRITDTTEAEGRTARPGQRPKTPLDQSDSAAIAAAEALASLTGGDGEDSRETPCSSEKAKPAKQGSKSKQRGGNQSSRAGTKTQAAAADSSTSVHSTDREDADDMPEADEGDESISGSSSTPSSSFPSDNEDNDDGECAIVSVKMAPEMRQSVALLAQVQMRLEALEKRSARLHQRLDMKINHQRRPHLDQRSSITKTIPGFWVTAVSSKLLLKPLFTF